MGSAASLPAEVFDVLELPSGGVGEFLEAEVDVGGDAEDAAGPDEAFAEVPEYGTADLSVGGGEEGDEAQQHSRCQQPHCRRILNLVLVVHSDRD